MIEEDAIGGVHAVAFAINFGHPIGVNFRRCVGTARLKHGVLVLRSGRRAKHFRAGGLIETGLAPAAAHRFKQAHGAQPGDIAGIFRNIKTHAHVTLRRQMVKLIRSEAVNQAQNPLRAGQIPVMQK